MKKLFILLIFSILIISACGVFNNKSKWTSFSNSLVKQEIEIIVLKDGKNGKTVEIVGEENVKEFNSLFEDLNIQKISDKKIKGYPYSIKIGTDQITFFDKMIIINEQYYKTDKEVPLEKIKTYFK